MRWRQVRDAETGEWTLIPIDEAAADRDAAEGRKHPEFIIRGPREAFRSPINGEIIATHRDYAEHCRKHNVVPADEFTPEFYAKKAKERQRFFEGKDHRSRAERHKRRQFIYETINRLERENG